MDGYVALGSNEGDRFANLRLGLEALAAHGLPVEARSSIWETEPVGTAEPHWFLNMVVRISTSLAPLDVLDRLFTIERDAGRVRTVRNAPRPLDLDLLLLGDLMWNDTRLVLPHPRMWERRFVVEPLREIAPRLVRKATGETIDQIAGRLGAAPVVRRVVDPGATVDPRKADPV